MTDPPPTGSAVPLTVIAGYLGAGKTTLLNHLITNAGGRRLAVLVNDFGELNIDADLIADHDGNTYSLTNGCVCCTVADDLGDVLQSIALDPNPPDEVYLEASGVTDGARFAALLTDWHGLAARGAIVVVDAEMVRAQATDRFVGDMIERQPLAGDLLVINKADLVDDASLDALIEWFESIGATAPVVASTQGRLPVDLVFGDRPLPSTSTGVTGSSDHLGAFSSAIIRDDVAWDLAELGRALDALSPAVVRLKGTVASRDGRHHVQMVGRRWRVDPFDAPRLGDLAAEESDTVVTELVVIALGADAKPIAEDLRRRVRST